jgi:hypothetical protein
VLTLTGFTLLSVLADTYGFLRGEEKWLQAVVDREIILTVIILILVVTLSLLGKIVRRRTKR